MYLSGSSSWSGEKPLKSFLQSKFVGKYRLFVNSEMLYVYVDLTDYQKRYREIAVIEPC